MIFTCSRPSARHYSLLPAETAANRLQAQLGTMYGLESDVRQCGGVALVLVGANLPVWGNGVEWWWWSGRISSQGQRVYSRVFATNAATAARLVADRYADLRASEQTADEDFPS